MQRRPLSQYITDIDSRSLRPIPTGRVYSANSFSLTSMMAVLILFLALSATTPVNAQLTSDDIAALRERVEVEGWTFTVGQNSATQYSVEQLCGLVVPPDWQKTATFDPCTPGKNLPIKFDWREITGCPPVRNQGGCGSCWAFSTVGALECNIMIKDQDEVDLSEQYLVSCNNDSWGCNGGYFAHDYHQWETDMCGDSGAVLEKYFPYTASDLLCNCPYPHDYFIQSWAYIGDSNSKPSEEAMKQAIMDYGPISIALHVGSAFQAYTGGVFNACEEGSINHAVVLVGWDDTDGYYGSWILRNSWGTGWGEGGYMRITYGCPLVGYGANYVNYRRAEKIAVLDDAIVDDAGGDGDGIAEPGETVSMVLTLENRYLTAVTGMTADLSINDPAIVVTHGNIYIGDIAPDDTLATITEPFELVVPPDYIPRLDSLYIALTWNEGSDTLVLERPIGGVPILVMDDDGDDNYTAYYTDYLDSLRIPYSVGLDFLSYSLDDFPIVIWFTGDYRSSILSTIEREYLMGYLNHGGKLLLSGQGIAGQLHTADPAFLHNYLKAEYVSTDFTLLLTAELTGDIFAGGDTLCIFGTGGANNQTVSDYIQPINGGIGELRYLNKPDLGAVSFTGDYQVVFFTFGAEAVLKDAYRWADRDTVLTRVLDYFGLSSASMPPFVSGLTAGPGDPVHLTTVTPLITWQYADKEGQVQLAYQLQVGTDDDWSAAEMWDSGPQDGAEQQAVYAGTALSEGGEYYLRVRVFDGSYWSNWSSGYMRLNSTPVIDGMTPCQGDTVFGDVITLTCSRVIDAENDPLTYSFQIYNDEGLTELISEIADLPPGSGEAISWDVPAVLEADHAYFWRARVTDTFAAGAWSEYASIYYRQYVCGDANGDGLVNVGDAVFMINHVFKGGSAPDPAEAGDANCDGVVNVGDAVYLINFVFKSGADPCCP